MNDRPTREDVEFYLSEKIHNSLCGWEEYGGSDFCCCEMAARKILVKEVRALQADIVTLQKQNLDFETKGLMIGDALLSAEIEITSLKAQNVRAASALQSIADLEWSPVTDGSGPEDVGPNEKGLYMFVGKAHCIAKEALEAGEGK